MRQGYLDAVDLDEIDALANELRRSSDTDDTFQARRLKILDLYLSGVQSRDGILQALRDETRYISGKTPT